MQIYVYVLREKVTNVRRWSKICNAPFSHQQDTVVFTTENGINAQLTQIHIVRHFYAEINLDLCYSVAESVQ